MLLKGTVKWFNNSKGYGFVVADNSTEELFAHYSSIQMEGYKSLKAGQAVQFETRQGPKGINAVNISIARACQQNRALTPGRAHSGRVWPLAASSPGKQPG